ncbi:MAG: phosphonopyruvate decarboxylase [Burkholderiales bacterium]
MIEAEQFIEAARALGYRWYCGVPCSFLTPFVNYTLADRQLHYLSSANEGDALASAAGAVIGGQHAVTLMQNSGLGNAINPLTSLAYVFRIPVLLIVTLRGDPELHDEPQHEVMGKITGKLLDQMHIPWEYFPVKADQIGAVLERAKAHRENERRPYALVMRRGSVAHYDCPAQTPGQGRPPGTLEINLSFSRPPEQRLSRAEVLERLVQLTPKKNSVIIATTGYTGRELCALWDRPNQLYVVGSMGCASSLGLGLSLARPDLKVIVVDGDGAALMRMGNFATIGAYAGPNFVHLVLDNEAHDSTGAQATVSAGVSFAHIARACGYPHALAGDELSLLDDLLADDTQTGPRFGHLKIRTGTQENLPRPTLAPHQVCQRLMKHIGSHAG